jgi:rhodanese-related sulfurtransferase
MRVSHQEKGRKIMFRTLLSAIALALVVIAPATGRAGTIAEATLGESSPTPDISTAEMRRVVKDGSAIIIDTRTVAEFDAGHIAGAKLVERTSAARVEAVGKITGGDNSKRLVLYCNGPFCQASRALAAELVKAGYVNVARYQLGLPVWRALGGEVAIERDGIKRIVADRTALFIDTRAPAEFAAASLPNSVNIRPDDLASAKLPDDDFNRRIILFGTDAAQARRAAEAMSKRPWHNVSYYPGSFDSLRPLFASR